MKFEKLLNELQTGKTFEEILERFPEFNVECIANDVYEDEDLYELLKCLGAKIIDYGVGYAVIETDEEKIYEISYIDEINRFDSDLPNETILIFDIDRIYDVTDQRNETDSVEDKIRISGIIFEHGKDDYGYWEGFSLTEDEENQIMEILMKHNTEGCSIRGTREQIF